MAGASALDLEQGERQVQPLGSTHPRSPCEAPAKGDPSPQGTAVSSLGAPNPRGNMGCFQLVP